MGFLSDAPAKKDKLEGMSAAFLHENRCKVCPLKNEAKVAPSRSETPDVYILGESPDKTAVERNTPFVGASGTLLRRHIPRGWADRIRFNHSVLSYNSKGGAPHPIAVECCKPHIYEDIVASQPKAIFGFGNIALTQITGETGIAKWAGKHMPVTVDGHTCWFFCLTHPDFVLMANDRERGDVEFSFDVNLSKAFALVEKLPVAVVHTKEIAEEDVEVITKPGPASIQRICRFLAEATAFEGVSGFDYETNRLRAFAEGACVLTAAISLPHKTMAFPINHPDVVWSENELEQLHNALYLYLTESKGRKAVHNVAFEAEWSYFTFNDDKRVVRASNWGCSLSQAFILDPRPGTLSLGFLTKQYFGIDIKTLSHIDTTRLAEAPVDRVCKYNGIDAKYHRQLYEVLEQRLRDESMLDVYNHHLQRVMAIVKTQALGLTIDFDETHRLFDEYTDRLKTLTNTITTTECCIEFRSNKGKNFNPGSADDTRFLVTRILKQRIDKADEASLSVIDHPIIPLILEYRHCAKALSTYIKPITLPHNRGGVVYPDNKLHPIINTHFTRTWRTSGSDPNTQNWSKRSKDAVRVRKQVVAAPGKKLIAVDFAGIQARNVAMESKDPTLVQAFIDHYDIHADWRERILSYYPDWTDNYPQTPDLQKVLRQEAKNKLVFPIFFGSAALSIGNDLKLPDSVAYQLYEDFWDTFPGVLDWHKKLRRSYNKFGYVTGLTKFRRYAPLGGNVIINTPIQSDESMIVLDAMIRLSGYEDDNLQAVLEVHDDLTFEIEADKVDHYLEIIITEMLRIELPWINVPLVVEASIGDNWLEMQRIGDYESHDEYGYIEINKKQ